MGWARYVSPNSNWGSHQYLGNAILTYGASYCPNMLPIPSCMDVLSSSHIFWRSWHSPWTFLQCSFFPWLGSVFVNDQWLGSLLGFFVLFPHFHGWGISCFQCCTTNGGQSHEFRDRGSHFCSREAIE